MTVTKIKKDTGLIKKTTIPHDLWHTAAVSLLIFFANNLCQFAFNYMSLAADLETFGAINSIYKSAPNQ